MPSSTITVRFDDELYHKVKNHEMNTSELIRTSVRRFLKDLEEKEHQNNTFSYNERQPVQQVKQPVLRQETPVYSSVPDTGFDASFMRKNDESEEISPLIEELTDKIDQLDDEINVLMDKYQKIKEKQ
jgi:uncharacterized coiled-coil DUF342 family protein